MANTRGIHWIVTTFASWLHGDPRGSWFGGKLVGPDPFLEETIRQRLTADTVVLSVVEMILVAAAMGQAVREKGWRVYAATVQATHAHLIFAPLREDITDVIATLKYRSACAVLELRRNTRQEVGRSLWTEGQYPVFIYDNDHLHNAIEYVRGHNLRAGREADPYPWIEAMKSDGAGKK
jgi:hypothetical protein